MYRSVGFVSFTHVYPPDRAKVRRLRAYPNRAASNQCHAQDARNRLEMGIR
jgi:hypothetical protein